MLYLLCIVDLQEVITTKLHICQLLVVFKKVDGEGHLAGCAGCCGRTVPDCQRALVCALSTSALTALKALMLQSNKIPS